MASVRTCYCKQKEDVSRKKDDDITDRNRYPSTATSKRLVIKNKACRSNRESPKREKSDEKMPKNRSVEVQSNPVLSPETSTALENAEKIINNAKVQLMEVCAMSSLDSARQNQNTYLDPPLDDEAEEMLYIRELVASKFYEASTLRSEANDRTSAHLEDRSPRVTVRRVDLSAPKFRMSRGRRRADCRSLEYGSDDRLQERASPVGTPSRNDSSSSKDSNNEVENEATTRDDRTHNLPGRISSATEGELVRARENTCKIQIGPSVHIVDRELTRQDLEDVHISPETSYCHANTATYVLRHFDVAESPVTSGDNELRKIPEAPRKTLRVRLDTSQHEGPIVAEAATETSVCVTTKVSDIRDSEQDDERNKSLTSRAQNCIDGEERKESKTEIVECLKNTTNQEAIKSVVIENSRTDNAILQEKSKNKVKITFHNDINYTEKGRIFNKDNDEQIHLRNEENTVDEIQEENPSDRSKLPPDNDTLKKIDFPRRGNIVPQTYRAMKSSRSHQTQIDERFTNTFDSHNEQGKLYDVTGKDIRHQSFISTCMDDSQIKDNLDEIDLYRPCLNDLDTILLSNERKIERVVRTVENFAEFLSRLESTIHGDKDKQTLRYINHEEFHHNSSADKDRKLLLNEPTRLTFETELKNTDLTVSCVPSKMHETNANSQSTSTDTIEIKSSSFTKESGSPSKYSKNSVESSVFPVSDSSDGSEISRDKVQRPRTEGHLSESSIYKSDVTTFSNIVPALSSTRRETQISGEKHITRDNHANAKRHVTSQSHVNRVSKRDIDHSQKEYFGNVFAQTLQKDTSEAADRFIAYLLQDEKRSIEGKVVDALKESTIAPVAVQKLLDNLRNVESIRRTRETETLDILKNILINIQSQTDPETKGSVHLVARSESIQHIKNNSKKDTCQTANVDDAEINVSKNNQTYKEIKDVETFPRNVADSSIRTNAIEESIPQTQVKDDANDDIGQIAKKSCDFKKSDKLSSDSSAKKEEKREGAAPLRSMILLESAQNSKNNSKGNSYSEAESLKQISDIRSDDDTLPRKSSQNSSRRTVSAKFNEGCTLEADNPATAASAENKEDDVNDERRRDVEDKNISQEAVKEIIIETHDNITSTNQNVLPAKVSEMKDEGIHLDANSSESIAEILEKEDVSFVHSSTKGDIESCSTKKNIGSQDSVVKEEVGLVANSCPDNSLQDHASLSSAKSSKLSLKEVASHIKQGIIEDNDLVKDTRNDETRGKSMTIDNHGDENEDPEFLKNTKNINEEQFASLSNVKKLSLKQVASHIEQSIITGENDLVEDTKDDETRGKSMTIDNCREGIEDSGFLKNTKSNNEQMIDDDLQKCKIDTLSGSNSCVSSTLLDYDNISPHDALAVDNLGNAKEIETSSETSHSEGELYMPSSCSYSLGEVRVLKKSELISSNSTDRESSATIFVTRSMLTSLNDSPMSLLGNSGCI
ncbi:uncharacterized protein LOC105250181 [Camponotus floridanus]|uniref:uncharacterized protein LOC105250181 n=1 Tax=Camponotus floridanus TaxID=104421 RepID=UPI000DC6B9DB|nr:uncharacterized protein LOC105250181 [Camponotus floridanus]